MIESSAFLIARSELERLLLCVLIVMSVNHCFEINSLIIEFESLYLQKRLEIHGLLRVEMISLRTTLEQEIKAIDIGFYECINYMCIILGFSLLFL